MSKEYITHTALNVEHQYEVVDCVPKGYRIWPIGKNMLDGYLPLCKLKDEQQIEGGMEVDTDSLKAIRMEGAQIILEAIGWGGPDTVKTMERYIKRYQNSKSMYVMRRVARYRAALPYMRSIKFE